MPARSIGLPEAIPRTSLASAVEILRTDATRMGPCFAACLPSDRRGQPSAKDGRSTMWPLPSSASSKSSHTLGHLAAPALNGRLSALGTWLVLDTGSPQPRSVVMVRGSLRRTDGWLGWALDESTPSRATLRYWLGRGAGMFIARPVGPRSHEEWSTRLSKGARKMTAIAMALPVLPGKEQSWRDYVGTLNSPEVREQYVASRRAAGMTRETVWSEQTPDGRLLAVVLMEADDVDGVFANLATSDDPFTARFRDFLKDVHGVDIATDPLPEVTMLSDTRF